MNVILFQEIRGLLEKEKVVWIQFYAPAGIVHMVLQALVCSVAVWHATP
jgi:hypothetical protein